ncbi:MAG: hypothetical protein Q8R92_05530 [Deltaproteobacteria bacterium]|nr:hypothetical protein [Deltaproteobacteria bacterium]
MSNGTTTTDLDRPEILEERPMELVINEAFIERLEKAATLYQGRYLPLAFKLTNEHDWVGQGKGRYYLQASGAEKLCNPFGISWGEPKVEKINKEDEHGKFYEYVVSGIFSCSALGRMGWFVGNCDSLDKFFTARPGWNPSNGEGDIRKAAFSNWITNGVTRLCGIRNPSEEMLKKAGLDIAKITVVDYSGQGSRTAEQSTDVISEAMAKRWFAIARQNKWTDGQMKALLTSVNIESSRMIKRNEYDELVAMVSKAPPTATTEAPA